MPNLKSILFYLSDAQNCDTTEASYINKNETSQLM
jgi:hypothetical protein